MSYENWKDQAPNFQVVDVRHLQGNFFPGLKQKAMGLEVGEGFTVIQTFEPHPLYAAMEALGFEHHTEQAGPAEFHVSFCRVEKKDGGEDTPFKPLALLNYPMIDEELGRIAVVTGDGREIPLIENGEFVLPGTEILNEPLKNTNK